MTLHLFKGAAFAHKWSVVFTVKLTFQSINLFPPIAVHLSIQCVEVMKESCCLSHISVIILPSAHLRQNMMQKQQLMAALILI